MPGRKAAFLSLTAGRQVQAAPCLQIRDCLNNNSCHFHILPAAGGNPDSNTLISDSTTVICLDDYHSLDRNGRKKEGVTALDPKAQDFELMAEQVGGAPGHGTCCGCISFWL